MRRRHELTDAQWAEIERLLPGKAGDPGRAAADNRLFVNARLYVLKTGVPWADLPERFGRHNSIWKRYDRPAAAGGWERVGRALSEDLSASLPWFAACVRDIRMLRIEEFNDLMPAVEHHL